MPGRGSNLSAWHYTAGEFRGRHFKYFEYRYISPTSATDDNRQPIIHAVFVVMAPGPGSSAEILRPGKLDVTLDRRPRMTLGIPEFDPYFRVVTQGEGFVRNTLSGAVVPYLLANPRARKSSLQLRDGDLFTWYKGTLSPQAVEEKLNYLCDVLDRIPEQAWTAV